MTTPKTDSQFEWTPTDVKSVDNARILAADAVEKVGNGHPGTAISMAPAAYLLYQKVMNTDPTDEKWIGRDRFVLSAGHASMLQYAQLYLGGLGLNLDDIKALRTWGSKTPGHPEYGHTEFVETTTGPLGSGISNAVGMAMAARKEHGLYDPNTPLGESVFDHHVYCIAGDGCLQEGVASEASSLAATQELGNLVVIWDDNRITIEGETKISFTEDVEARYAAYGWHVQHVDFTHGGTVYKEDPKALFDAIEAAKQVTDKPSFIRLTTIIGWPLPNLQGTEKVHGNKLGAEEITALKAELGYPDEPFAIDQDAVAASQANVAERGAAARKAWDVRFAAWQQANPEQAALLDRVRSRTLPELTIAEFEPGKMSTRKASGAVLSQLADQLPELWGGSADLAGSNDTSMKGAPSFLPGNRTTAEWQGDPFGRTLHFGIREHAMGGILNGIQLSGLTRPYGGTFFVFSDYMRPPVRLASLMKIPTLFVWTHDSIGVGEDGPTHEPIEQLASLRAMPVLQLARPADANETAVVWRRALASTEHPVGLVLTRQDVPVFDRKADGLAPAEGAAQGAYVLKEASAEPQLILIGTGSEVQLCLGAATQLEAEGVATRVVSMPSWEWFEEQSPEYREQVLPTAVTKRVSVEAGVAQGWEKYVGAQGASVAIDHFGASAAGPKLFTEFGFTVEHVLEVAREVLA